MIKVQLYTDEEWRKTLDLRTENEENWVMDAQGKTFPLFLESHEEDGKGAPFRDPESVRVLKECGYTFVSEDDWYSLRCDDWSGTRRIPLSNLNYELRFALLVIWYSRQGRYTWLMGSDSGGGSVGEQIWKLLADLPFDIRIAIRISDMGILKNRIEGAEYRIVNYPYGGRRIQVTVRESWLGNDPFYTEMEGHRECSTAYGLCMGKDGQYYSDGHSVEYAFQYYWKNDIQGIIEHIKKNYPERFRLAETCQEYNVFSFAEALGEREGSSIVPLPCGSWYEEVQSYLYFRDKFRIICHLAAVPKEPLSRKLPLLMVDKNKDGSYGIHGSLTVKYPTLGECMGSVIEERSPERERFILVVDREELLSSARDIDSAVYGFRLLADSIELFEPYEAVRLFGQALEEVYGSGNCEIADEFY